MTDAGYYVYRRRIPWTPAEGGRTLPLGRHVHSDSRSAWFAYRAQVPESALADTLLTRHIPILDQGSVGSCEGNSEVGEQGTDPFFAVVPAGTVLDENLAVALYSAAEDLDGAGPYPPNDNGTSNLSMAKAAKAAGLISGYQDAATVQDIAAALQSQPVRIGVNWYSEMDQPSSSGLVRVGGYVRGGHALLLRGVQVAARLFRGDNSWGASWGDQGSFDISWDDMARLLAEEGEATVSVPLSQPAPQPVPPPPPPVPDPDPDLAYGTDERLAGWAGRRHAGDNAYAAKQYTAWRAARGYLAG